jgi:DNA-binding NarL/FixJ family response regulator
MRYVTEATDLVTLGRVALSETRWEDARDRFDKAVELSPEDPVALEGVAEACTWTGDAGEAFRAGNEAFRRYQNRGDDLSAGRVAILLGNAAYDFRGDIAVARGWAHRAKRLLEPIGPTEELAVAHAFDAHLAIFRERDPVRALEEARAAAVVARQVRDVETEMASLALEGLALTSLGHVTEGTALLDEASTALMAGQVTSPLIGSVLLCYVVAACDRIRDLERADAWCRAMTELCERWSIDGMVAACRTQYAGVLLSRGTWDEAEAELRTAADLLRVSRPGMAADAIVRLAELRRRQGRAAEAEALCREADADPFRAQAYPAVLLVRGELALDRGDRAEAVDLADRYLRSVPSEDRALRAPGLELAVRSAAASRADVAPVDELRESAAAIGTLPVLGAARFAEGVWLASKGGLLAAKATLEDAVDLFLKARTPYEEARARAALAHALAAAGRSSLAEQEASAARDGFLKLGARGDADRAAAILHAKIPAAEPAGLSRREREVLRLLARGLTNQEIAADLVLSVRTVERHVSNIYAKVGASGRAARVVATDYAHTHGMA